MELLPIIIVLSLLAFFVALMLIILAFQYSRSKTRRKVKQNRHSTESARQPTRHMTVRNGRVIRLSDSFRNRGSGDFNSQDLSTLRSGESTDSSHTKDLQYPAPLWLAGQRISAVCTDLEAQRYQDERKRLSEKVFRTLGESRLQSPTGSLHAPKFQGTNKKRQASITESLLKAYKGPAIPGTEPVELPASPLSRPIIVRKLSQKPPNAHEDRKLSPPTPLAWRSNST